MRQVVTCLAMTGIVCSPIITLANENPLENSSSPMTAVVNFKPFTGKITRNKVRMRLKPSLDSPILKELSHEDMVIVIGESDEFYVVRPPQDVKAYVFRTFVLDNVIEGNHINVRLDPDTEAPIIAQLNSGDRVEGIISPLNSKWLEINPPESVKFYVCKEYVENIGAPSLMSTLCKRRDDVNEMLETTNEQSQAELQKPYEEIRLEKVIATLNKIIAQYPDFPGQVAHAKEQLNLIQDAFLQKKLAYLENKADILDRQNNLRKTFPQMTSQVPSAKDKEAVLPSKFENNKTSPWSSKENAIYEAWANSNPNASIEEFYVQQQKEALLFTGIVEPYIRSVRNKPGDYILISKTSKLPVAYLYSTKIDLNSKSGQEVTISAMPRPNYDFAFPAYFVLSVE